MYGNMNFLHPLMARAKIALPGPADFANSVIDLVSCSICAIGNSYCEFVAVRFHAGSGVCDLESSQYSHLARISISVQCGSHVFRLALATQSRLELGKSGKV